MNYSGQLEIFAEISVAFVGFTGVVIALMRTGGRQPTAADHRQLRLLLIQGFIVLFFSLLPHVFSVLNQSSTTLWRACNFLLAAANGVATWYAVASHLATGNTDQGAWRKLGLLRVLVPISISIILLQIASGIGLVDFHSFTYLLALLWLLAMAGLNFLHLLMGLLDSAGNT